MPTTDVPLRLLAALLCAALTGPVRADAADDDPWSRQVLDAVNGYRAQHGLVPLSASAPLRAVAAQHSDDMRRQRRLSHDGFQARFDRIDSLLCVENVAAGTTRPAVLIGAWSRATLHRKNLMEPRLRRAGIAVAGDYVTLFACE